jgi:hypothetical protein
MMRNAKVVLVGVMSISLAGCVLNGRQKGAATPTPPQPTAPATPPEPLSIPQTTVELPPPQTPDPEAFNTVQPAEPSTPAQNKPPAAKPRTNPGAGGNVPSAPATLPKAPETQAAPEPPPEPVRPPLQELLPDEEKNRLKDLVHLNQAEAQKVIAAVTPKNSNQRRTKAEVQQFLKQSQQAEGDGNWRLASQFAERANLLAKELQSGK